MRSRPSQVLLTFDIEGQPKREDFFDSTSLFCLETVLGLLEKNKFEGIFFITGSAAEQIQRYPNIVKALNHHEIGYHSASHSTKPRIIEYTDIESYEEAVAVSVKRETSHINRETGQTEGEGGIISLRRIFPHKNIVCFRAPFLSWSPPHLEALRKLGLTFDFSSDILDYPVSFRGITFYPSPISIDGVEATFVHRNPAGTFPRLLTSIFLQRIVTVLLMHPSGLIAKKSVALNVRTKLTLSFLRFLLERIRYLQEANLIEVTSLLSRNWQSLDLAELNMERVYRASVRASTRLFGSNPRFIRSHFIHFFGQDRRDNEFGR